MTANTITSLPISKLHIDGANVRKIGRGADHQMIASILSLGIQTPLIVRENSKGYAIIDGGKRFAAAQFLIEQGTWKPDAPIPVKVTDDSDSAAREKSLHLNIMRRDMHPVDEFRAIASMHADKAQPMDIEALSTRLGCDRSEIVKSLALGALADEVLDAWRDGFVSQKGAQAFTLIVSKKDQIAVLKKLRKEGDDTDTVDDQDVRRCLGLNQQNPGRMLKLIGADAYAKRGGKVTPDLFGGGHHIVSDAALVGVMVQEAIDTECKRLVGAGWSSAVTEQPKDWYSFGYIHGKDATPAQKKKLSELRKLIPDEYDDDDADAATLKAVSDHDQLEREIEEASFTKAQRAKGVAYVTVDHRGDLAVSFRFPPEKARAAINSGSTAAAASVAKGKKTKATKLSQALVDRLRQQRLTAIRKSLVEHPHGNKFAAMLATIVASQINVDTRSEWHSAPDVIRKRFDEIADSIDPKVMNAALRKAFDAPDYFAGAPKAFVVAAISEGVNVDEARKISGKSKKDAVAFANANVPETWLPRELRTAHYDGPAKKAAPAKPKSAAKANAKKSTTTTRRQLRNQAVKAGTVKRPAKAKTKSKSRR